MAVISRDAPCPGQALRVEILSLSDVSKTRGPYRLLKLANGAELSCHAPIGSRAYQWRKLDAPGVERLTGAGIYYGAAMTEAIRAKMKTVCHRWCEQRGTTRNVFL